MPDPSIIASRQEPAGDLCSTRSARIPWAAAANVRTASGSWSAKSRTIASSIWRTAASGLLQTTIMLSN